MITIAVPSRWSDSQPTPSRLAPRLGEHTSEILAEFGFEEDAIARLAAEAVMVK
jgi:crotonobetainyl-CoA:carnitine CoA-transferase CaiB-like acyl-CoA transferase